MTDKELEKKAERYARNSLSTLADTVIQDNVKQAYIKGAKAVGNNLKEQLGVFESYINDIPNIIDPCDMCKHKYNDFNYSDCCRECCWRYYSGFELREEQ